MKTKHFVFEPKEKMMANKRVALSADRQSVQILDDGMNVSAGYEVIGEFDHENPLSTVTLDDDAQGWVGNHTMYHHMRDILYRENLYDMSILTIEHVKNAGNLSGYIYWSANGSGDGSSETSPLLWSKANVIAAMSENKVWRLLGPAAPPTTQASARRADEYEAYVKVEQNEPTSFLLTKEGLIIESWPHPDNPEQTPATFVGTRNAWTKAVSKPVNGDSVTGWTVGTNVFGMRANNITFRGLHFRRVGTAFVFDTNNVGHGVKIEYCTGYNVQRMADLQTGVTVNNGLVDHSTVIGHSKSAYRCMANCSGWIFRYVITDSGWQANDSFARCVYFDWTAHDMLVEFCSGKNIYNPQTSYWNGDSFETNSGNYNIIFRDCGSEDTTDGGFDCKGKNIQIIRCVGKNNKRTFRNWGEIELWDTESEAPKNQGDTGNGSTHFFGVGVYDPNADGLGAVSDPLVGLKGSNFRAKIRSWRHNFKTTGQDANTTLVLLESAGAIMFAINPKVNGVAVADYAALAASPGGVSLKPDTRLIVHVGSEDPTTFNNTIVSNMTHVLKEGGYTSLPLVANDKNGNLNDKVIWHLDREHPMLKTQKTIDLTSWTTYNPKVKFLVPDYPSSFTINVTVEDVFGNLVTAPLNVTSSQRTITDAPVYAGATTIFSDETLTHYKIKPNMPTGLRVDDVHCVLVHTNKTTSAPTCSDPDYHLAGSQNQSSGNHTTHFYWKWIQSLPAVQPEFDFGAGNAISVEDPSRPGQGKSATEIYSTISWIVRGAKVAGGATPFENFGQNVSGSSNKTKTSQTFTTTVGNRLAMALFVMNNDETDMRIGSTPEYEEGFNAYDTLGSDVSFYMAYATLTDPVTNKAGANVIWDNTGNATSQQFKMAWIPRQDPV